MDSKLKRLTIACAFFALILLFLLMIYANRDRVDTHRKSKETGESIEKMTAAGSEKVQTPDGIQLGNDLSGFMSDESFFDKEKTKYEKFLEEKNTLSLMLTSIEKDLRIKILDHNGDLVSGKIFKVQIEGEGTYSDMDRDGIIYIRYLPAGDYLVSLEEMDGFTVPKDPVLVNVKEQLEYVAMDDISMLIKTEEEIDPEVDDTGKQEEMKDRDKTERTDLHFSSEGSAVGIDVSKWNKEIDWEKVKKAGIDFAIIRCGYRGSATGSLVEDPFYEKNIEGALDAGLDAGIYFFTQAKNEVEAVEEASAVLSLAEARPLRYPVFIDTEGAGGNGRADGLDKEMRTRVCKAFCDTIENAGYESGIYASKHWYENNLDMEELKNYKIWLAEYREAPTYEGYYDFWQYTSKGKIDGIEGNVDLNISYQTEE